MKRNFLQADFRGNEPLWRMGPATGAPTAEDWLKGSNRLRLGTAAWNALWLGLSAYATIAFFLFSFQSADMTLFFRLFAALWAVFTWYMAATLIWMYRNRKK